MEYKRTFVFFAFLFIIFSINLVSSEIIITQPSSLYNIGDSFSVNVAVSKSISTNAFFIATLVCDQNDIELYRSPLNVLAGETKNINVSAKLDRSLIRDSKGSCFLQVDFADQLSYTQNFKISDNIEVKVNSKSSVVNPGEQLVILGSAKKENGKEVDGFVEVTIKYTNISLVGNVDNGDFSLNVTIPGNMPANQYTINARVYERDFSDEITNEGRSSAQVKVNQVLSGIKIALDQEYIKPGSNISYTVYAYDQSDLNFPTDINSIIYSSADSNNPFLRKMVASNQNNVIIIPKNASPGEWVIEAFVKSFTVERQFFIEANKEISIKLENNTLLIFNEGNVDYDEPIEMTVCGSVLPSISAQTLNLTVGKERKFLIAAPSGICDISWRSANQNYSFSSVKMIDSAQRSLIGISGAAISLKDLDNVSTTKINTVIWILVILFLVLLSIFYYLKVRKKNFTAKTPSPHQLITRESSRNIHHKEEKVVSFIPPYNPEHSEENKVTHHVHHHIKKVNDTTTPSHSKFRSVHHIDAPKITPINKPITYQRLGGVSSQGYNFRDKSNMETKKEPIVYKRLGTDSDDFEFKPKPINYQNPIKTYSELPKNEPKRFTQLNLETYNPGSESAISGASKEEVVVISLKIKNAAKLTNSESSAFMTIEHALNKPRALKAKVYDQGDSKVIVFSTRLSPKVTAVEAVKTAIDIDRILKEFNRKYAIKIEYGLGVNTGEMFFEIVQGKAKFTSVGSTLLLAKNAADKANSEVLLSQALHRKVYSVVRGEITPSGLYRVNSFIDRNQNSPFIQRFMKNNEDSTKFRQL